MEAIFKRSPGQHSPEIETKFKQLLKVQKIQRKKALKKVSRAKNYSNSDSISFFTHDEQLNMPEDKGALAIQKFPLISRKQGIPHIMLTPPLQEVSTTPYQEHPLTPNGRMVPTGIQSVMEGTRNQPQHMTERIPEGELDISIFTLKTKTTDSLEEVIVPPHNKYAYLNIPG